MHPSAAHTAASIASALRARAIGPLSNVEIYVLLNSNHPGEFAAFEAALAPECWLMEMHARRQAASSGPLAGDRAILGDSLGAIGDAHDP